MKKVVLFVLGFMLINTGFVHTAPAKTIKVINKRFIQATKEDITVPYAGIRVFVPVGQAIILGQLIDGTVVIKGRNLNGVQLNDTIISSRGESILNYQPRTQRLEVTYGANVTVQDPNGRMAVLSQGAAITASDIRTKATGTPQVLTVKTSTATQPQQPETSGNELPNFIAEAEISNAVSEQASQDVKETETILSQSIR